jgi:hypothetical protein
MVMTVPLSARGRTMPFAGIVSELVCSTPSKRSSARSRRHRRMNRLSSARPAEDGRHAAAGFLAHGSGASPAFPFPVALWSRSPLTVAGAAADLTAFPTPLRQLCF